MEVAQAPDGIGFRRNQDVPRLEDGWELRGIDIFRIDQHFSRREWHESRIDVQWLRAVALDLVNAELGAEVTTQPFDARYIGGVAACDEQVGTAADEIGGIEQRLELVDDVAYRLTLGSRPKLTGVQTIEQLRLRRGEPARPLRPVLLEQRAIGVRLEIARSPCHRRSEEHTSELQSQSNLVCRLLLEKKKKKKKKNTSEEIHTEQKCQTS